MGYFDTFSLEIGRFWGSWEGYHVAYVLHACNEENESLKAESETGMGA